VFAGSASFPDDFDPETAPLPLLIDEDVADNQSDDLFAIGRCGRSSMPDQRYVLPQSQDIDSVCLNLGVDFGFPRLI
jgi:hypothetical protein